MAMPLRRARLARRDSEAGWGESWADVVITFFLLLGIQLHEEFQKNGKK
jgi:hypothetical protein